MTETECRQVYQQLVEMLNDNELLNDRQMNWIIEETNDVIRAGKIIEEPDNLSIKSSRKFITTRELTPQEALLLLIDAIEAVVVQTALIEEEVTSFFQEEGEELNISPEIRFLSEEENLQPIIFTYSSAIERAESASLLGRLLMQLRSEVTE